VILVAPAVKALAPILTVPELVSEVTDIAPVVNAP
jgi:hypothetical protein